MRIWFLLLCAAMLGTAEPIVQARQDNKVKAADPQQKAVLDALANHKAAIEQSVAKTNAAVKAIEEIKKQNALTEAELKKLEALARDIDNFKADLGDKGKVLAELQAAFQKSIDDRAKVDGEVKLIQDRLAKLEVGGVQERAGKLQKQAESFKYNTKVEVEYFGPAPGRPQPFYKVRVIRVTGEKKDQPLLGVKIGTSATTFKPATQTTTDLEGFEPKNYAGVTGGKDGVAIINRPNVKGKPGIHKIEFSFAGDDAHLPSSSGELQIK